MRAHRTLTDRLDSTYSSTRQQGASSWIKAASEHSKTGVPVNPSAAASLLAASFSFSMAARRQAGGRRRLLRATTAAAAVATTAVLVALSSPVAAFIVPSPAASVSASASSSARSSPAAVQREAPATTVAGAIGRSGRQPDFRLWSATVDRTAEAGERVGSGGGGPKDALEAVAAQFEGIYNRALVGKPAALKALFAPQGRWEGIPMADKQGDLQEALDVLDQARSFMLDPRATVTGSSIDRAANQVTLDWQLSGTWPFPYRPRVRAAGTWTFTLAPNSTPEAPQVLRLEERWDRPWWKAALEQASPKGWDLWHLYLTPPAEKPLYRVVQRFPALEIREYYPRALVELETHDTRPGVKYTELAWLLPDFAFTDELKLQGRAQYRETYVTTGPVESCVESVEFAGAPAKRIRWKVPLPSHVGMDLSTLPSPPHKAELNATVGDAGRYVVEGRRFVAVRTFKGLTQTDNYGTARRWLLSWCQKEGLQTKRNPQTGKSQVWVGQHNMKAGFNMAGSFCLGIYEQPSYSEWGEISVELEPDAHFFGEGQGSGASSPAAGGQ